MNEPYNISDLFNAPLEIKIAFQTSLNVGSTPLSNIVYRFLDCKNFVPEI